MDGGRNLVVKIEYCLEAAIQQRFKSASVHIYGGRQNSFEVTVNDKLIFSKLKRGDFPDTEAIISELIAITNGETPKEVTKCQPRPKCSIL
ncbi:unnamed protein product [Trichobilharzia szidati]|nr:unnamed protein product [Trichobilharzia szidati]